MRISLEPIRLDLKVNWKISRNESLFKNNFVVRIEDEGTIGLGEIAPNIRYGETPENIQAQFDSLPSFSDAAELLGYCSSAELLHSLACGLNCAATSVLAGKNAKSVEEYLGLTPVEWLPTSISVPIMETSLLKEYLESVSRFPYVKIKVDEDNAVDFVKEVAALSSKPLRVDANEAFSGPETFLRFVEQVKHLNIQFIEQPFKAADEKSILAIKGQCPFEIMADESIEDRADFDFLAQGFDSINIKLMKTGGYYRALGLIREAKKRNMKVMLGCMIESSLGISCAMRLASLGDYFDLDGSLLVKNEPFGLLKEKEGRLALN